MKTVILARHAESALGAEGRVNGDPAVANGLTEAGEEQARLLGETLAGTTIDLCVTTAFERTRATAELALAGRDVPCVVVADLNEISFGRWEGGPAEDYLGWAWTHGPEEACPGGGESRVAAARRLVRGLREIAARPEQTVLVVGHGLAIRYVLTALRTRDPKPMLEQVPLAEPQRISRAELEGALDRLEAWLEDPRW